MKIVVPFFTRWFCTKRVVATVKKTSRDDKFVLIRLCKPCEVKTISIKSHIEHVRAMLGEKTCDIPRPEYK